MTNGKIEVHYADLMAVQQGLEEVLEIQDNDHSGIDHWSGAGVKVEAILNTVKAMIMGNL